VLDDLFAAAVVAINNLRDHTGQTITPYPVEPLPRNQDIGTIIPDEGGDDLAIHFDSSGTEGYVHLLEGQKVEVTFVRMPK
jgi:cold shock CspA family protein